MAAAVAVERLEEIFDEYPVDLENPETLIKTAKTTLNSKMYELHMCIYHYCC